MTTNLEGGPVPPNPRRTVTMLRSQIRLILVAGILALVLRAAPALAQGDVGIEYTGSHEAGGILHVTLSPAGDHITAFDVDGIAGGGCSWDTIDLSNWGGSIPVVDGHFEVTNADGDQFSGRFLPNGRAEGTIQVHDPVKGCETPPLRWAAATPG
jgi:hypothetical protein